MKLKPLHDNVVIKALKEDEVTRAGIVLPETADKEKPERGEVVAIGPGKLLENGQRALMSVAVGNKVLFKKYSPDEIKLGDEEYLVISEGDVIAVIESVDEGKRKILKEKLEEQKEKRRMDENRANYGKDYL